MRCRRKAALSQDGSSTSGAQAKAHAGGRPEDDRGAAATRAAQGQRAPALPERGQGDRRTLNKNVNPIKETETYLDANAFVTDPFANINQIRLVQY